MSNIKINTGEIRLTINDDESRVIVFNPGDQGFINRYYAMLADFDAKEKEFIAKAAEIDKIEGENSFGIKLSAIEGNKLMIQMCEYMKGQIDFVFGKGASEKAFGNMLRLDMFDQFLGGVSEFISKSRNSKIEKYTSNKNKSVMK